MTGKPGMNKRGLMGGRRKGAGLPIAPIGSPFTLDAVPAIADVISGAVKRPREFRAGENPMPRLTKTTAWERVSRIVTTSHCVVLARRGDESVGDHAVQIRDVRELLGEADAIVVLMGRRVLVAFNADATRAALMDAAQ